jgi:WD40 repeat protein
MNGEGSGNPPSREPIDRLAEEFVARYRRGEWPQISEYLERHPELETEIRAVFPPLILMERAALQGPPSGGEPDRIGPYRTIRLLGAGGQGQVFLAEDTRLKRRVALKVLAEADPAGQMLARFRREAAVTAKLDHPGICTVYEAGEDRGAAYIAMRYVEGETLAQRIAAGQKGADTSSATREGIAQLVALVERAARALHVAHEAGLVHRDIKPGNLMITPAGDPVILDFGLARDIGDEEAQLTRTGMRMGTPVYMSPEQIAAERLRIDRRTDVYSLGVTLYEALTLKRPFEAATWDQLYHQILSAEPEAPRRRNPMVPPDLQVVLSTAMEKDRDRRYQTALDLAEDLRRVRELEPIRARPAGALLRLKRWAQRNPVVAASVAAAFLALAVGLAVSAKLLGETRRERDAKAEALARAGGAGLAAQALAMVEEDPGLALSLAVEAARRAPGPQANAALVRALELNRERRRFDLGLVNFPTVALSPDGTRIATNEPGGALVDLQTGARIPLHAWGATGLRFSPDGTRLVALGGTHGPLGELLDASTGARVASFELTSPGGASLFDTEACFSADGRRLWTRGAGRVHVWDTATGELLGEILGVEDAVFGPDGGSVLAWGAAVAVLWSGEGSRTVLKGSPLSAIWDAQGPRLAAAIGERVQIVDAITGVEVGGLRGPAARAWWSPDGLRLFTTSLDGMGRLWDVARGEPLCVCDLRDMLGERGPRQIVFDGVRATWGPQAVFSPDGSRVLVHDPTLRRAFVVDALHGGVYGSLVGHQGGILRAAFSGDGKTVATASHDGTARIWDVAPESPVVVLRTGSDPVVSVAFAPDGRRVVTAEDWGPIRPWDAATGAPIAEMRMGTFVARFSSSGATLFAAGSADKEGEPGVQLFDAATGAPRRVAGLEGASGVVAWSPDGRLLAAVREPGQEPAGQATAAAEIVVLETDTGAVVATIPLENEGDGHAPVGFSPDGRLLLVSVATGVVAWDIALRRPAATFAFEEQVAAVCMTPDGRLLVAALDAELAIWRMADGAPLARLRGHSNAIVSLSVSPHSRLAATASVDGTARVWDLEARTALYTLEPGTGALNLARIGPDGRRLLTVAPDGDACLWELATGDLVVHYPKPEGRNMFVGWYTPSDVLGDFSSDGRRVITASWDGVVRIRPADPLEAALATHPRELTAEERAEFLEPLEEGFHLRRDARRRVDALFHELIVKEDVLARLETDREVADDARAAALDVARGRETDREAAHMVAWTIVGASGRSEAERRWAIRLAETLLRGAKGPEIADTNVLLAAARCRVGDHRAATEALARVEVDTGASLAVRALAHALAGRAEEARACLARAREAPDLDSNARALVAEAEALVGPK